MTKKELIFDGNEKRVYNTDDPATVVFHFKDVATAFNNVKTAVFPRKGIVNNKISAYIFDYLGKNGIYTHYIATLNDREQLCRKSENIPLEVVVRNYIAGTLSDRLESRRAPSLPRSSMTSTTTIPTSAILLSTTPRQWLWA